MESVVAGFAVFAFLVIFLSLGIWVFASILLVSVVALYTLGDMDLVRIGTINAAIFNRYAAAWELSAIPMFIWMGEIVFRTDISMRLFRGLSPFVNMIPGRLLHTNVMGCTMFAAISGSSTATTATVGKITTRELFNRGYDKSLSVGSLAGAGSLGLMIPPSLVLIVYGILAEQSVAKLFAAGVFPGLMISGLFTVYIAVRAWINPSIAPEKAQQYALRDYLSALGDLFPILLLMTIVLGSIYTGVATPSEAAAVGVCVSLILVVLTRQFSLNLMVESLMGALKTSTMICILLIAAAVLSTALGFLHIPKDVAAGIASLELSPWGLLAILSVFYLGLGLLLEGNSIVVMTLPIALPLVVQAGFDPVWFGIYLVLMIEMAAITPPIGFNLFVLQGATGYPIGRVARSAFPFFLLMVLGVFLLAIFPQIALWFPNLIYGS
ncbi:TRAP transporter large permease subunit [Marivita sp. S6314]|uniref:TRAP transporter large permease n=1 Tax=Marivita sp. S6314 TaxID=2926406 RepID=UPI001FF67AFC|nr:TRAP transporter large permease subunit [Marivita sp. S6314]MCK0150841.1 TRAP transporter large permease subunit [Marivita sp. S6314]